MALVETVVITLVETLIQIARDEVALVSGLETKVKNLQKSLNAVKDVLPALEEKQTQSRALRDWIGMLKNFCYDAEDVLDEWEYKGLRRKVLKQVDLSSRFPRKMALRVQELENWRNQIAEHDAKFNLAKLAHSLRAPRGRREITDSFLGKADVIGRDTAMKSILASLFRSEKGKSISVIPIVGIGGIGKTTLAKMLYNDSRVKKHFDPQIWVCVSKIFEHRQIMISMLKRWTDQDRSRWPLDKLRGEIQERLKSKRFLLVLDDVWSHSREKWIDFQKYLEVGAAGSRVIVTTRDTSVADIVRTGDPCKLGHLSHEECFSLFKKFAFREGKEESHPHLKKIGNEIVKKCGGVPLAVKAMGTLLYSKSDDYWESTRDSEKWKLEQEGDRTLPVLKLSYDELSSHLKPCFAMCSIFPKGYKFDALELSRTWMANGLLQSSYERQDMEDIGVQYIKELHCRSFLQDPIEEGDVMSVMSFKMHDLMHDLALSISQSECFVVKTHDANVPDGIRYLAFIGKDSLGQEVPSFLRKENRLRTIFFSREVREFLSESFVDKWISSSKYLRMLDFRGSPLEKLPRSIGGLKLLRTLNLSYNSIIKRLPDSICKLYNLLYLHLLGCSELEELPGDIRNLIKLRYLSITVKQKRLPEEGIGCLISLRILRIRMCVNLEHLFEDIKRLTSLRVLEVWGCGKLLSLPSNLMYLDKLRDLRIQSCGKFNWGKEKDIQDIKLSLRSLTLQTLPLVKTLPQWLRKSSKTLQCLEIISCKNFSSFPKLLKDFTSLKKIKIVKCPKLVSLPEEMGRLIALEELTISGCPVLHERCKKPEGEDWLKIARVPKINLMR